MALPPFNGFVSEWLTLQTLLRSAELSSTSVKIAFALCGAGSDRRDLFRQAVRDELPWHFTFTGSRAGYGGWTGGAARNGDGGGDVPVAWSVADLCHRRTRPRRATAVTHSGAAQALVPPFFQGSPGHNQLARDFMGIFPSAASGRNGGLPARTLESGSCGGRSRRRSCL